MGKDKIKKIVSVASFLITFVLISAVFTNLFTPKRTEFGATVNSFLEEETDSFDVMFFGSSVIYCDIIPAVLWENTGISSYILAGPSQEMSVTLSYVEEAFKRQSPKYIFIEFSGIFSGYSLTNIIPNIDNLPAEAKPKAIINGAKQEDYFGLVYPVYNHHNRWSELGKEDFQIPMSGYKKDMLCGYTFLSDVKPQGKFTRRKFSENWKNMLPYVEKIHNLAESQNCKLVLFEAPSTDRVNKKLIDEMTEMLTNITFISFYDYLDEFDLEADFHDGLHFNYSGAEKFTKIMGDYILRLEPEFPKNSNDTYWQERLNYYQEKVQKAPPKA